MDAIPRRLRSAMAARGLSPADLGRALFEVDSSKTAAAWAAQVSRWSAGSSTMGAGNLAVICRAMEVSSDWILGISSDMDLDQEGPLAIIDRGLASMVKTAIRLKDKELATQCLNQFPLFIDVMKVVPEKSEIVPVSRAWPEALKIMAEFEAEFPSVVKKWRSRHDRS